MSVLPEDLAIFSLDFGTIVLGANQIKIRRKTPSGSLFLKDVKGQLLLDTFGNNKYKVKPGPLMERLGHFNDVHVKYNNNWDTLLTEAKKTIKMSSAKPAKQTSDDSVIGSKFTGSKFTTSSHYETITGKLPPTSWSRLKILSALVKQHYSNKQLRLLADYADVDSRITTTEILRTKLADHFDLYG